MMPDDVRVYARIIHLVFSLLVALVVYCLTWYTLSGRTTSRWRYAAAFSLACAGALLTHWLLDVAVGVP